MTFTETTVHVIASDEVLLELFRKTCLTVLLYMVLRLVR